MIKLSTNIFLTVFILLAFASCDSNQVRHKKTLEEQLTDNYVLSPKVIRSRIEIIVSASKNKNYALAMNELGILSSSQINDDDQKRAIRLLMAQLRFNLEEDEILARNQAIQEKPSSPAS